jgi:hypothetical protein
MSLGWLDKLFVERLKRALEAPKENPIPRSGSEGEAVDCYSVYVSDADGSYLAECVQEDVLVTNKWNEEEHTHNLRCDFNVEQLNQLTFEIHHYHGLVTHTYNSKGMFLRYEVTGYYKLVSLYALSKFKIPKFLHSKKPLKRPSRIKILETLDIMTEDNPYRDLKSTSVCDELYGHWSIFNSQRKPRNDRIQRILESLVESGELKRKDSFTFNAQGKLIVTLEHLKEEKARQDRAESNALWMRRLTAILVVTALFQSGLVRTTYFSNLDWLMELLYEYIHVAKTLIK